MLGILDRRHLASGANGMPIPRGGFRAREWVQAGDPGQGLAAPGTFSRRLSGFGEEEEGVVPFFDAGMGRLRRR